VLGYLAPPLTRSPPETQTRDCIALSVARFALPALTKQPGRSLRLAAFTLARDALIRDILVAHPSGQLRCSRRQSCRRSQRIA